jgi:hypothetical protein
VVFASFDFDENFSKERALAMKQVATNRRLLHFEGFGLVLACLLQVFLASECVAGDDRVVVLKNATQGFKQSGKTVAPHKNPVELIEIATQKTAAHSRLAKLIVARDLLSGNLETAQRDFGNRFSEAETMTRVLFAEGTISNGIKELSGEEPNFAQDALDIMKTLSPSIDRGLQAITNSMETARNGLLMEKLIRHEIRNRIAKRPERDSVNFSDKIGILEAFYESKGSPEPHASFKLTNRSGKDLREALVFLEIECEYDFSASRQNNAIGQALVDLISGGTGTELSPSRGGIREVVQYGQRRFLLYRELEKWTDR